MGGAVSRITPSIVDWLYPEIKFSKAQGSLTGPIYLYDVTIPLSVLVAELFGSDRISLQGHCTIRQVTVHQPFTLNIWHEPSLVILTDVSIVVHGYSLPFNKEFYGNSYILQRLAEAVSGKSRLLINGLEFQCGPETGSCNVFIRIGSVESTKQGVTISRFSISVSGSDILTAHQLKLTFEPREYICSTMDIYISVEQLEALEDMMRLMHLPQQRLSISSTIFRRSPRDRWLFAFDMVTRNLQMSLFQVVPVSHFWDVFLTFWGYKERLVYLSERQHNRIIIDDPLTPFEQAELLRLKDFIPKPWLLHFHLNDFFDNNEEFNNDQALLGPGESLKKRFTAALTFDFESDTEHLLEESKECPRGSADGDVAINIGNLFISVSGKDTNLQVYVQSLFVNGNVAESLNRCKIEALVEKVTTELGPTVILSPCPGTHCVKLRFEYSARVLSVSIEGALFYVNPVVVNPTFSLIRKFSSNVLNLLRSGFSSILYSAKSDAEAIHGLNFDEAHVVFDNVAVTHGSTEIFTFKHVEFSEYLQYAIRNDASSVSCDGHLDSQAISVKNNSFTRDVCDSFSFRFTTDQSLSNPVFLIKVNPVLIFYDASFLKTLRIVLETFFAVSANTYSVSLPNRYRVEIDELSVRMGFESALLVRFVHLTFNWNAEFNISVVFHAESVSAIDSTSMMAAAESIDGTYAITDKGVSIQSEIGFSNMTVVSYQSLGLGMQWDFFLLFSFVSGSYDISVYLRKNVLRFGDSCDGLALSITQSDIVLQGCVTIAAGVKAEFINCSIVIPEVSVECAKSGVPHNFCITSPVIGALSRNGAQKGIKIMVERPSVALHLFSLNVLCPGHEWLQKFEDHAKHLMFYFGSFKQWTIDVVAENLRAALSDHEGQNRSATSVSCGSTSFSIAHGSVMGMSASSLQIGPLTFDDVLSGEVKLNPNPTIFLECSSVSLQYSQFLSLRQRQEYHFVTYVLLPFATTVVCNVFSSKSDNFCFSGQNIWIFSDATNGTLNCKFRHASIDLEDCPSFLSLSSGEDGGFGLSLSCGNQLSKKQTCTNAFEVNPIRNLLCNFLPDLFDMFDICPPLTISAKSAALKSVNVSASLKSLDVCVHCFNHVQIDCVGALISSTLLTTEISSGFWSLELQQDQKTKKLLTCLQTTGEISLTTKFDLVHILSEVNNCFTWIFIVINACQLKQLNIDAVSIILLDNEFENRLPVFRFNIFNIVGRISDPAAGSIISRPADLFTLSVAFDVFRGTTSLWEPFVELFSMQASFFGKDVSIYVNDPVEIVCSSVVIRQFQRLSLSGRFLDKRYSTHSHQLINHLGCDVEILSGIQGTSEGDLIQKQSVVLLHHNDVVSTNLTTSFSEQSEITIRIAENILSQIPVSLETVTHRQLTDGASITCSVAVTDKQVREVSFHSPIQIVNRTNIEIDALLSSTRRPGTATIKLPPISEHWAPAYPCIYDKIQVRISKFQYWWVILTDVLHLDYSQLVDFSAPYKIGSGSRPNRDETWPMYLTMKSELGYLDDPKRVVMSTSINEHGILRVNISPVLIIENLSLLPVTYRITSCADKRSSICTVYEEANIRPSEEAHTFLCAPQLRLQFQYLGCAWSCDVPFSNDLSTNRKRDNQYLEFPIIASSSSTLSDSGRNAPLKFSLGAPEDETAPVFVLQLISTFEHWLCQRATVFVPFWLVNSLPLQIEYCENTDSASSIVLGPVSAPMMISHKKSELACIHVPSVSAVWSQPLQVKCCPVPFAVPVSFASDSLSNEETRATESASLDILVSVMPAQEPFGARTNVISITSRYRICNRTPVDVFYRVDGSNSSQRLLPGGLASLPLWTKTSDRFLCFSFHRSAWSKYIDVSFCDALDVYIPEMEVNLRKLIPFLHITIEASEPTMNVVIDIGDLLLAPYRVINYSTSQVNFRQNISESIAIASGVCLPLTLFDSACNQAHINVEGSESAFPVSLKSENREYHFQTSESSLTCLSNDKALVIMENSMQPHLNLKQCGSALASCPKYTENPHLRALSQTLLEFQCKLDILPKIEEKSQYRSNRISFQIPVLDKALELMICCNSVTLSVRSSAFTYELDIKEYLDTTSPGPPIDILTTSKDEVIVFEVWSALDRVLLGKTKCNLTMNSELALEGKVSCSIVCLIDKKSFTNVRVSVFERFILQVHRSLLVLRKLASNCDNNLGMAGFQVSCIPAPFLQNMDVLPCDYSIRSGTFSVGCIAADSLSLNPASYFASFKYGSPRASFYSSSSEITMCPYWNCHYDFKFCRHDEVEQFVEISVLEDGRLDAVGLVRFSPALFADLPVYQHIRQWISFGEGKGRVLVQFRWLDIELISVPISKSVCLYLERFCLSFVDSEAALEIAHISAFGLVINNEVPDSFSVRSSLWLSLASLQIDCMNSVVFDSHWSVVNTPISVVQFCVEWSYSECCLVILYANLAIQEIHLCLDDDWINRLLIFFTENRRSLVSSENDKMECLNAAISMPYPRLIKINDWTISSLIVRFRSTVPSQMNVASSGNQIGSTKLQLETRTVVIEGLKFRSLREQVTWRIFRRIFQHYRLKLLSQFNGCLISSQFFSPDQADIIRSLPSDMLIFSPRGHRASRPMPVIPNACSVGSRRDGSPCPAVESEQQIVTNSESSHNLFGLVQAKPSHMVSQFMREFDKARSNLRTMPLRTAVNMRERLSLSPNISAPFPTRKFERSSSQTSLHLPTINNIGEAPEKMVLYFASVAEPIDAILKVTGVAVAKISNLSAVVRPPRAFYDRAAIQNFNFSDAIAYAVLRSVDGHLKNEWFITHLPFTTGHIIICTSRRLLFVKNESVGVTIIWSVPLSNIQEVDVTRTEGHSYQYLLIRVLGNIAVFDSAYAFDDNNELHVDLSNIICANKEDCQILVHNFAVNVKRCKDVFEIGKQPMLLMFGNPALEIGPGVEPIEDFPTSIEDTVDFLESELYRRQAELSNTEQLEKLQRQLDILRNNDDEQLRIFVCEVIGLENTGSSSLTDIYVEMRLEGSDARRTKVIKKCINGQVLWPNPEELRFPKYLLGAHNSNPLQIKVFTKKIIGDNCIAEAIVKLSEVSLEKRYDETFALESTRRSPGTSQMPSSIHLIIQACSDAIIDIGSSIGALERRHDLLRLETMWLEHRLVALRLGDDEDSKLDESNNSKSIKTALEQILSLIRIRLQALQTESTSLLAQSLASGTRIFVIVSGVRGFSEVDSCSAKISCGKFHFKLELRRNKTTLSTSRTFEVTSPVRGSDTLKVKIIATKQLVKHVVAQTSVTISTLVSTEVITSSDQWVDFKTHDKESVLGSLCIAIRIIGQRHSDITAEISSLGRDLQLFNHQNMTIDLLHQDMGSSVNDNRDDIVPRTPEAENDKANVKPGIADDVFSVETCEEMPNEPIDIVAEQVIVQEPVDIAVQTELVDDAESVTLFAKQLKVRIHDEMMHRREKALSKALCQELASKVSELTKTLEEERNHNVTVQLMLDSARHEIDHFHKTFAEFQKTSEARNLRTLEELAKEVQRNVALETRLEQADLRQEQLLQKMQEETKLNFFTNHVKENILKFDLLSSRTAGFRTLLHKAKLARHTLRTRLDMTTSKLKAAENLNMLLFRVLHREQQRIIHETRLCIGLENKQKNKDM